MGSAQPIYILADDLTGAADAANYFRTDRRRVRVSFSPVSPWTLSFGPDVVQVFDSESRVLTSDEAAHRVGGAAKLLAASVQQPFFLFKKVDSTLRGHIGCEIEALLAATGRTHAVLAPTLPAHGRTVENGRLFVHGVPVTQTAFAQDPHNPVMHDRVSQRVQETTSLPVVEIGRDVVAEGSEEIARAIKEVSHPHAIIVVDARTEHDLAQIAHGIAAQRRVIPCGSAGLAKPLAQIWGCSEETSATEADHVPTAQDALQSGRVCRRVIIAVGSANPVAHQQLTYAASVLRAPIVELDPVRLAHPATRVTEIAKAKEAFVRFEDQPVVGVVLGGERARRHPALPGTFEEDLAQVVMEGVRRSSGRAASSLGFVATGGDTALALCQAMSAHAIWPLGEVMPGVPWSTIETERGHIPLVTKAGGFGEEDALRNAAEFLLGKHAAMDAPLG
ncbi:four-carbon acid sugar kinase family protein [Alicyclobacillus cycloheptanicus]|uniref:Uncharacterized protein YgbK (DUF1537 family) n=1 Tax=Alicyclobacillus cycloheptanicus TaxID=1457 RepID=A0ABT9XFG9_9BACL|nr:four-carbon acid sugar kinase family protein [Alicyclobacillus cycloheptanicus]MDQ0189038.1 uncharacterized protein YgbK (DUF1537 family) [Alicyclobacillus cycloheptanicus]WDM00175.1 four-carbon acid sugar kinase family protein [Alicyclobacillus cycloheptanicus]